jgi:hypothetical protein
MWDDLQNAESCVDHPTGKTFLEKLNLIKHIKFEVTPSRQDSYLQSVPKLPTVPPTDP